MDIETSGIQSIPAGWRYQVIGSMWHMLQQYDRCRCYTGSLKQERQQTGLRFRLEFGEDLAVCQERFYQYKTGRGKDSPWSVSKIAKDVLYHFAKNWIVADRASVEFHFVTDRLSEGFLAVQRYIERLRGGGSLADLPIQSPLDSRRTIPADEFNNELADLFQRLADDESSPLSSLSADDVAEFLKTVTIEEPLAENVAVTDAAETLRRRFVPRNVADDKVRELFDETFSRLCSGSGEFTAAELLSSVGIASPMSWDKIKEFADLHREDRIQGLVDKHGLLDPGRAVPRADAEAAFGRFLQSDKPALLLSGSQGTGKTTLLIRLARQYAESHAVVIRGVGDLNISSITSGLLEHMDYQPNLMTLPQVLWRADQGLRAGMKLLVFGDGADETDLDTWRGILSDIASMVASDPALPIRFCFSVRHEVWHAAAEDLVSEYRRLFYSERAPGSDPLDSVSVRLGDFDDQELDQALQEWNLRPVELGAWRDLLRTPRHFGIYALMSSEARRSVLATPPRPAALLLAYLHDRLREVARHTKWDEHTLRLELIDLCTTFEPQLRTQSRIGVDEFRTSAIAAKWRYPDLSRDQVYGALVHSGLIRADGGTIGVAPDELIPCLLAAADVNGLARLDPMEGRQRATELVERLNSTREDVDYWRVALTVQVLETRPDLEEVYVGSVEELLRRWQLAPFFRTVGPAAVHAMSALIAPTARHAARESTIRGT